MVFLLEVLGSPRDLAARNLARLSEQSSGVCSLVRHVPWPGTWTGCISPFPAPWAFACSSAACARLKLSCCASSNCVLLLQFSVCLFQSGFRPSSPCVCDSFRVCGSLLLQILRLLLRATLVPLCAFSSFRLASRLLKEVPGSRRGTSPSALPHPSFGETRSSNSVCEAANPHQPTRSSIIRVHVVARLHWRTTKASGVCLVLVIPPKYK